MAGLPDLRSPTLLPAKERASQPWKNGGGMTWDVLASWPRDADGLFDWRVSIAEIAVSGPFSLYEGVDRLFMPLSGGGVTLSVDDHRVRVDQYQTIAFAGEASVAAVNVVEPTIDLNVMARRGRAAAELSVVWFGDDEWASRISRADQLVIVLDGSVQFDRSAAPAGDAPFARDAGLARDADCNGPAARANLARLDAVLVPAGQVQAFRGTGRLALITITRGLGQS